MYFLKEGTIAEYCKAKMDEKLSSDYNDDGTPKKYPLVTVPNQAEEIAQTIYRLAHGGVLDGFTVHHDAQGDDDFDGDGSPVFKTDIDEIAMMKQELEAKGYTVEAGKAIDCKKKCNPRSKA